MTDNEVEKVYQEFWLPIISTKEGELDGEQLKKELYDYYQYMGDTAKVYDVLTGGQISKVNTCPKEVIRVVEQRFERITREAIENEKENWYSEHDIT